VESAGTHVTFTSDLLRPNGAMEAQLSERAIICAWRLRRVYRIETGMFSKARKSSAPAPMTGVP
jgi:hypothetical protein